jgi:hypothetical protein
MAQSMRTHKVSYVAGFRLVVEKYQQGFPTYVPLRRLLWYLHQAFQTDGDQREGTFRLISSERTFDGTVERSVRRNTRTNVIFR